MNHRFFNKTKIEQQSILTLIAIRALTIIAVSIIIAVYTGIYLIGIVTFAITLSIIAPFFDMPSLKSSDKIVYYSPLFLAEKPKNNLTKIHGGTLFDYYFVIDRSLNGKQRTDFIIQQYLSGLLAFIEKHKTNKQMKVRGTSYIINKRTAEKIGFKVIETNMLQKIILIYNYFNVMVSNSIAKNKLAFPKLSNTKTFEADIGQLLAKRDYIETLSNTLK